MNYLYKTFCTALGLGYIPYAPGTFGSLGALFIAWSIKHNSICPEIFLIILTVLTTFLGVFFSNKLIPEWGNDPSKIVIDEVAGMWLILWFVPNNGILLFLGFLFFRIFDIKKPFFIKKLEKIKGGWGIMLDDIGAGMYANVLLQLFIFWGHD